MMISPDTQLDKVLDLYANSAKEFDAKTLSFFISKYPQYRQNLLRYATVQLLYRAPSRQEIEEDVPTIGQQENEC